MFPFVVVISIVVVVVVVVVLLHLYAICLSSNMAFEIQKSVLAF